MSPDAVLAVHSVDHFNLSVPDLAAARAFYEAFGLDVREVTGGARIGAFEQGHLIGHLTQGPRRKLQSVSYGVYAEDLAPLTARARRLGVEVQPLDTVTVRLRDIDGLSLELHVAEKTSPSLAPEPALGGHTLAPSRSQAPAVRPDRFSHLLLFTADVDKAVEFYCDVLGLRVSDRAGRDIAFLHSPHGSDHHLVAFVKSTGPGLHHSSWDVRTIDEVGLGARQLAQRGYCAGWGVGRHVLGSNYFYYAREPGGGYVEYSFDMDYIARGQVWPARTHDADDAFFIWGPEPPDGFAENTEIA